MSRVTSTPASAPRNGHYLAPFLGTLAGVEATRDMPSGPGAVRVHVELDPDDLGIGLGF
jgi:hypothetical protein